jgi:long-subunit acyl-CoA synthetase (AMP-forming)
LATSPDQAYGRDPLTDPVTFDALLRKRIAQAPDQVALRERHHGLWRDLSWSSLGRSVDATASLLQDGGLAHGAAIAVVGRPSLPWLIAELAALRLGASTYSMSDRPLQSTVSRLRAITGLRAVLVVHSDERRREAMADEIGRALNVQAAGILCLGVRAVGRDAVQAETGDLPATVLPGKLVVATAGTSAEFRWVALDEATLIVRWGTFLHRFGVGHGDRIVAGGSLDYWANRLALLTSFLLRCAVLHFNDDGVADQITRAQVRPTVAWSTARDWATLADLVAAEYAGAGRIARGVYRMAERLGSRGAGRILAACVVWPMLRQAGLSRVRTAWAFGDRLSNATATRWASWGVPLIECYGDAERGGFVAVRAPGRNAVLRPFEFLDPAVFPQAPPRALDERFGLVPMRPGAAPPDEPADAAIVSGADIIVILPEAAEGSAEIAGRLALFETGLRESPYVREAVVFAGSSQLEVVIEPNVPGVLTWARARRLRFGSIDRLLALEEVQALFAELLSHTQRSDLPPAGKVIVVPDLTMTQAGSLVSRSGRPRRAAIAETYLTSAEAPVLVPGVGS